MLEQRLLEEFSTALQSEIADREEELPLGLVAASATALAETLLGYLEEAGAVAEHDLCPHQDEGVRRPCRIIAISLAEDSPRLDLYTCPDTVDAQILTRREIARLAGGAARFFDYAAKGDHGRFAQNTSALEAAARIQEELARIEEVRISVLTNARVRDRDVEELEILGRRVVTEVWDLERLYRAAGEAVTRDRIEIDFEQLLGRPLACLEMKPRPAEYETFMVILPGTLIYQLFDQYGPRLFEFNVRSFLQARGAVNKGIQRTIKEEPGRFLAYNNGLTATADEIEVASWHGETVIKRIRGLQIVNGAQTTASIHRAVKVDRLSVDQVAVSMKLTRVPSDRLEEFVPLIARFANTQNPIQVADLSASDRFHQEFELLSQSVWPPGERSRWFYERARGSYQLTRSREGSTPARKREFDRTCPRSQHFGKTDLAKYLMTWWRLPQVVSRGAQKNYAFFMFHLRERMGEDWIPDRQFFRNAIAQAILFRSAQATVRKARLQSYGANVVTYMVALLSEAHGEELDLDVLWENQTASHEMTELFATWAPIVHAEIVSSAGHRNVTEWCKKDDCWTEIRSLKLKLPTDLPPEFMEKARIAIERDDEQREEEQSPVLVCTSLDAPAWARVMAWATAARNVDEYDLRVAHTLSGYAMSGWIKQPSPKQAARGARVVAAARTAGALSAD